MKLKRLNLFTLGLSFITLISIGCSQAPKLPELNKQQSQSVKVTCNEHDDQKIVPVSLNELGYPEFVLHFSCLQKDLLALEFSSDAYLIIKEEKIPTTSSEDVTQEKALKTKKEVRYLAFSTIKKQMSLDEPLHLSVMTDKLKYKLDIKSVFLSEVSVPSGLIAANLTDKKELQSNEYLVNITYQFSNFRVIKKQRVLNRQK